MPAHFTLSDDDDARPLSDAATPAPAALLERFKSATGGDRWDTVSSVREHGTIAIGGLAGAYEAIRDLRNGRSVSRHVLGSMRGAAGYDGAAAWQIGPGGEVAVLDAPEARRRARSQAWLDVRGYWFPDRGTAVYGPVKTHVIDDEIHHCVDVTPDGGDPMTLWLCARSAHLVRIVRRRGADVVTTRFEEWCEVDGVSLPFLATTTRTDAAGIVDPRQSMRVALERIVINVDAVDEDFQPPTMATVARIEGSQTTTVPFDLVNNHIYVDGEVDGQTVRFLVDTGGMNLLTPAAALRLGLVGEGRLAASGPGEQRVDVAMARGRRVRVGSAVLDEPVFYVIDLGELPAAEGVDLDGAIGYEMFRRFGVHIDYAGRMLTLTDPAAFVAPVGATPIEFQFDRLTPIVDGMLDGLPMRIMIDTGSRVALTLTAPFVAAHDLVTKYDAAPEAVLGWGVGGGARVRPARLGRLMIGDIAIDHLAGDLSTRSTGGLANPDQSGNLGGAVLRRFTVSFDYARKHLYLVPNAEAGLPMAFDRSGLWLMHERDALRVGDVAPDSAGERAGLHVGDRIVAIDGVSIAMRGLSDWRKALCDVPVDRVIAMNLIRDDQAATVELVAADRLPARWTPKPGSPPSRSAA